MLLLLLAFKSLVIINIYLDKHKQRFKRPQNLKSKVAYNKLTFFSFVISRRRFVVVVVVVVVGIVILSFAFLLFSLLFFGN